MLELLKNKNSRATFIHNHNHMSSYHDVKC